MGVCMGMAYQLFTNWSVYYYDRPSYSSVGEYKYHDSATRLTIIKTTQHNW